MHRPSIWIFENIEGYDESFGKYVKQILPVERIEHISRLRFSIDRKISEIAYLMLFAALFSEYGYLLDRNTQFIMNPYGKPFLPNGDIYFNISHCRKGVACAISTNNIGLDIQNYEIFNDGIIKAVFSSDEINKVVYRPSKNRDLTALWTMKESYLKYVGTGIDEKRLKEISFDEYIDREEFYLEECYFNLLQTMTYCLCICSEIPNCHLRTIDISTLRYYLEESLKN